MTIDSLTPLIGTWTGTGTAAYPDYPTAPYTERWTIQADELRSLLQYEQITHVNGELLSWEFGFIRPQPDDKVELMNTQNNGRVEVLKGSLSSAQHELHLSLVSSEFGNDPRMVHSRRDVHVQADALRYTVWIATRAYPYTFQHLSATLTREG